MIEFGRAKIVMKLRPFAEKETSKRKNWRNKRKKMNPSSTKVKRILICMVVVRGNHLRDVIGFVFLVLFSMLFGGFLREKVS